MNTQKKFRKTFWCFSCYRLVKDFRTFSQIYHQVCDFDCRIMKEGVRVIGELPYVCTDYNYTNSVNQILNTLNWQTLEYWHSQFALIQSRKLVPDRRTTSDKFPAGPVVFVNSPDQLSGKLFCQLLPLRIDKSRFLVNST